VLRIRDVYSGSQIPDPDFYPSRIPDLDPGSNNSIKRGRVIFIVLPFFVATIVNFIFEQVKNIYIFF
jgi:hypothetical protein